MPAQLDRLSAELKHLGDRVVAILRIDVDRTNRVFQKIHAESVRQGVFYRVQHTVIRGKPSHVHPLHVALTQELRQRRLLES